MLLQQSFWLQQSRESPTNSCRDSWVHVRAFESPCLHTWPRWCPAGRSRSGGCSSHSSPPASECRPRCTPAQPPCRPTPGGQSCNPAPPGRNGKRAEMSSVTYRKRWEDGEDEGGGEEPGGRHLQQWVDLLHWERQRVPPLPLLNGSLSVCDRPLVNGVREAPLNSLLQHRPSFGLEGL